MDYILFIKRNIKISLLLCKKKEICFHYISLFSTGCDDVDELGCHSDAHPLLYSYISKTVGNTRRKKKNFIGRLKRF